MRTPRLTGATRLAQSAAGISGMLAALLVLVVAALAIWGLTSYQDKADSTQGTLTAVPDKQGLADKGSPLFTIPFTDDGIHYFGDTRHGLSGFAVAEDGTLWIGAADNRLLRYSPTGQLLGILALPPEIQHPVEFKLQGTKIWVLDVSEHGTTLYQLARDGRALANHRLPSGLVGSLAITQAGEVLLGGNFTDRSMGTPAPPQPVGTIQPLPGPDEYFGYPFYQVINAQGNLDIRPLDGYPHQGKLYSARPADVPWKRPTSGIITANGVQFTLALSNTLGSLRILWAGSDSSFYVMTDEQDEKAPYVLPPVYHTVYHYSLDGKLIEWARVPTIGRFELSAMLRYMALGPNGEVYSIRLQPDNWVDKPQSLEAYRMRFVPPEQPLPATPPPYMPTASPPWDLFTLTFNADIVAQVEVVGSEDAGGTVTLDLKVEEWLKNRPNTSDDILRYRRTKDKYWDEMPQSFRDNATRHGNRYIMFLGVDEPDGTYFLMGLTSGAFLIRDGKIVDAGASQYEGWTVEKFKEGIKANLMATPGVDPSHVVPTADLSVSTDELIALKAKADLVVQVGLPGLNWTKNGSVLPLQVGKWLKNPNNIDIPNLNLYITDEEWSRMPATFQGNKDPMEQDKKGYSGYVMFLTRGDTLPGFGDTYRLTDGPRGAFLIRDQTIIDAGIPEYIGWPLDNFTRLITGEPTPVPSIAPEPTSTRSSKAEPLSLAKEDSGYRLDVYEGGAAFGNGSGPWIGPSHLLVSWFPVPTPGSSNFGDGKHYLLNVTNGKLEQLPGFEPRMQVFPRHDGKRVVLVRSLQYSAHIAVSNLETGQVETVFDSDPAVPQWRDNNAASGQVYNVTWISQDAFVLEMVAEEDGRENWGSSKLVLVNLAGQSTRLLAPRGKLAAYLLDGSVLWQSSWIDGEILLLSPPYTGEPVQVVAGGTWFASFTASPDRQTVAWLELEPPPGDWSKRLPNECCTGDPPPVPKAITVLRHPANTVQSFPVANFAWPHPDLGWSQNLQLGWRNDSGAIYYAAHRDSKQTDLRELTLNGQETLLAQHDAYTGLRVLGTGADGSLYYALDGRGCQNCNRLMRRHRDGRLEVVYAEDMYRSWYLDKRGRLMALKDGGVFVTDLTTGESNFVRFPGETLDTGQLGWSSIEHLVPLSPDGRWVAYAGSTSDDISVGPDGRAMDRGRTVRVVKVK